MSDIALKVCGISKRYAIQKGVPSAPQGTQSLSGRLREWCGLGPALQMTTEEFWALQDVSFEVKKGDVVGVIGRNGAGKSTLLKVLSRITEPTHGHAEIDGRVSSLLEVGTGFHGELSGRENIYLNAALLGMKRREISRKLDQIVDFSGVEEFLDTPVKKYSSGMYVRLAFAVAAYLEPDILIVDEVLAVGDASFQQKCIGKMEDVSKSGRTVLVVSHNLDTIESLCNSCVLLHHGKVDKSGPTRDVVDVYARRAESLTSVPLRQRTDRAGSGAVIVSDLQVLDATGRPVQSVICGREVIFRLHYESMTAKTHRRCLAAVSVHGKRGEKIFLCATGLSSGRQLDLSGNGFIDFIVPELPLSGAIYHLEVYLASGEEILDGLADAMQLTVVNGDFYGGASGRVTYPTWEGVGTLVKHSWRLWSDVKPSER